MLRSALLLALAAFYVPALSAQPVPFDVARLADYFDEEPTVEVNLQGSLLRLAAAATREDEPETAALIEGLNAVTVRVYPLSSAVASLGDDLSGIGRQLEAEGWYTFVRVRNGGRSEGHLADAEDGEEDGHEDVWIYVRDEGDAFNGLVVMALDPEEDQAAFVLIDGLISPDQVGSLSTRFRSLDFDGDDEEDDEDEDEDEN